MYYHRLLLDYDIVDYIFRYQVRVVNSFLLQLMLFLHLILLYNRVSFYPHNHLL